MCIVVFYNVMPHNLADKNISEDPDIYYRRELVSIYQTASHISLDNKFHSYWSENIKSHILCMVLVSKFSFHWRRLNCSLLGIRINVCPIFNAEANDDLQRGTPVATSVVRMWLLSEKRAFPWWWWSDTEFSLFQARFNQIFHQWILVHWVLWNYLPQCEHEKKQHTNIYIWPYSPINDRLNSTFWNSP